AEALANLLAVHLIRNASRPRALAHRTYSALSQRKLRAVAEYIEEYLDTTLTLGQMAAAANLSPFHFSRQFKVSIGMTPHQYVLSRRVERAQQLLQQDENLSLARIAMTVGFSDQSQFSHHFKRVVGVTPRQFRRSARIA